MKTFFSHLFRNRRPFKLTRAGWVFILYTIGVGAGAINTGNNLLYIVFGVFLGLLLASGLLSDLSLWSVELECAPPVFARANEVTLLPLYVKNRKKLFSSFSIQIEFEGKLQEKNVHLSSHIPFLQPKETASTHFSLQPPRRGYLTFESFRLTTQYPFGLLKKWWMVHSDAGEGQGLFIYPAAYPLDTASLQKLHPGDEDLSPVPERGSGALVYGVREFQNSDNPKHIHWKASAKQSIGAVDETPVWLVREMEKERKNDVVIYLPSPGDIPSWNDDKVERMISYAAAILEECRRTGRVGRLVVSRSSSGGALWEVGSAANSESPFQFLALWNPRVYADSSLDAYLKPIEDPESLGGITFGLLKAFETAARAV